MTRGARDRARPARSAARRRRILDAAISAFVRYGFRRASVDLIAAEARVAKPTLYAYFADKEGIFRAAGEQVCDDLLAGARLAAARRGPVVERVTRIVAAKFGALFDLLHRSPHGRELLDSQNVLGREAIERTDRALVDLLAGVVEDAAAAGELDLSRLKLSPRAVAALVLRAGHGASWDALTPAAHRRHLAELIRVLLAGLAPGPDPARPRR